MAGRQISKKIEDIYTLSPMQQGMLFHALYDPDSPVYSERNTFTIEGELNLDALQKAWEHLGRSHPLLRTIFRWKGVNEPVQIVLRERLPLFAVHDLSLIAEDELKLKIDQFLIQDRANSFDLSKGPLMRLNVLVLSEQKYMFIWTYHHILIDGWCQSLIMNDLFLSYLSLVEGKPLPDIKRPPFKNYISWIKKQEQASSKKYWVEQLHDFSTPAVLSPDYFPKDRLSFGIDKHTVRLPEETTQALQDTARRLRVTLSTLVQSAWAILLNRFSLQDDVVFGVTISGRPAEVPGTDQMIGLFINSLPVRTKFNENLTFLDLLNDLQRQSIKIQEYGYSFLPDVKACSAVRGSTQLFNNIVIFENFPTDYSGMALDSEVKVVGSTIEEMTNFDLTLFIIPNTQLELSLHYANDIYSNQTIANMMQYLPVILDTVICAPEVPISSVNIIPEEHKNYQLYNLNDTEVEYSSDKCTFQLFENQAAQMPEACALVSGTTKLSYRELNNRSNQLARLLRSRGVVPDQIVGIMVERSAEMIIGLLAILKAGGAYLPLDPAYPIERLEYMLSDSNAKIVLTHSTLYEKIEKIGFEGDLIDIFDQSLYKGDKSNLEPVNLPHNLMYVIYTSGSTGKPKGVMIEHRNVVNFIKGMTDIIDFAPQKKIVCLTTISFDIFVLETHLALAQGLQVIMADEIQQNDPLALRQLILEHQVDMLQTTPSRFRLLMGSESFVECMQNLSDLIIGGEPFPDDLLQAVRKACPGKIYNVYGPTETTVWSTVKDLTDSDRITIGKPIANTQIYILDKYQRMQPLGVAGELCISGDGLARGYMNRTDLTAEKFIDNPLVLDAKIYRTGDLARWLPSGELDCLGRMDYQVKIRGNRIELGEIQTALAQHEAISDIVVVDKDDRDGNKYLAAYYVADNEIPPSDFRNFLKNTLPDYMIPSRYILLSSLPLTPNGKVDRKVLPDPETQQMIAETEYIPPRNEFETNLANLWQDVLRVERVGINDNFFDLGGHSLLIMKVLAKLQFEYPLNVQDFFDYQNIAELSAVCADRMVTNKEDDQPELKHEEHKKIAVTIPVSGKKERPRNVLLTGSTGYLGAHLLYELLQETDAHIYCFIRGDNDEHIKGRLESIMEFYFPEEEIDRERITVVQGDLTQDDLGLSSDMARTLSNTIDTVIHAAADVRHFGEYSHFRNINVLGTSRLLDLAKNGNCKRFHHVSTLGISGDYLPGMSQMVFKEEDYDRGQILDNVYARSKFEAEGLVRDSGLNTTIYRVGILVGDSLSGRFQRNIESNAFYSLLKAIIHMGAILDGADGMLEMTPIDACREAIVKLMMIPETAGRQLHIFNPHYISIQDIASIISSLGYVLNTFSEEESIDLVNVPGEEDQVLENLMPHISRLSSLKTRVLYDNTFTQYFLDSTGFHWPEVDRNLIDKLISYCVSVGFIKEPSKSKSVSIE